MIWGGERREEGREAGREGGKERESREDRKGRERIGEERRMGLRTII